MCADKFAAEKFPVLSRIREGGGLGLKRLKSQGKVLYVSAIAHQLAAQPLAPPSPLAAVHAAPDLAQQIVEELTRHLLEEKSMGLSLPLPLPPSAAAELVISTGKGLIYLEVSDRALAQWLDTVLIPSTNRLPLDVIVAPPAATAPLFEIQHAHARCCSLLRLAHQSGTVTLERADAHPCLWQIQNPAAIPWLTPAGQLVLEHAAERCWVGALFDAAVGLQAIPPVDRRGPLVLATAVAIAFAQFHRDRPLFAPPASGAERHAQLGLMLVTQRLLYSGLKTLKSPAPTTL